MSVRSQRPVSMGSESETGVLQAKNHGNHELNRLHSLRCMKHECERKAQLLVLTPIAKPLNRFAACGDLRAREAQGSQR